MSNKTKTRADEPLIPFQVKVRPDVRERVKTLATKSGLSANDIASLAIGTGISLVETKLAELQGLKAA